MEETDDLCLDKIRLGKTDGFAVIEGKLPQSTKYLPIETGNSEELVFEKGRPSL